MRRITFAAFLMLFSTSAHAGFEWVPVPEIDRVPMTRAQNIYDNSFDMGPPVINAAPAGMNKGELVINPYPVSAGFSDGTDPFTSQNDHVGQAMMEETGLLGSIALGSGMSTGIKQVNEPSMAQKASGSAFAMDPYPLVSKEVESEPLAAPVQLAQADVRRPMIPNMKTNMSDMLGGEVAPLPGYEEVAMNDASAGMNELPKVAAKPMKKAETAYTPTPVMPVMPQEPAPTMSAQGMAFEQAIGFGNDLPLALALSQVIPPQFALSFHTGVDAGTNVSWEGGKPWNEVLSDMLSPLGLRADISGKTVMIRKGS